MTNPADLAYMMDLANDEKARQRAIVKARHYHNGWQPVEITDRMREFLGLSTPASPYTYDPLAPSANHPLFVLNVSRIVVQAVTERLGVVGFDSDEPALLDASGKAQPKPFAAWAWERWTQNRMDGTQDDVHTAAVRDGRGYVMVDGDDVQRRARFTYLPEYTDASECDGDGYGVRTFYEGDGDTVAYACKYWTETTYTKLEGGEVKRDAQRRMDRFWPDRVERFVMEKGQWAQIDTRRWADQTGQPLGIPIVPFCNVDDRAEATDCWPMQDLINKTLVDVVSAADMAAIGFLFAAGFYVTSDGQPPQEDGSNALHVQPGSIIQTLKSPKDADLKRLPGEDVTPIAELVHRYILWTAGVTSTPPARFTPHTNIKAEGTLKEEEGPLLAKLKPKATRLGNSWEDVFYMARKIENTFYGGALPEDAQLTTQWAPTATRDELQERQALLLESQLGVPKAKLWAKLGYSQDEIAEMEAQAAAEDAAAIAKQQALMAAAGPMMAARNGQAVSQN